VLVVITFAWWTPSWYAKSGREAPVTVIRGKPVNMEEWQREQRILQIHAQLGDAYAQLMDPGAMFGKITPEGVENSLLFEGEAGALGVSASQEEIERQLAATRAFAGMDGKFDANRFEGFVQRVLNPEGFSKTQIEQFMAAEVRARKIAALLASTIPPTPEEVKDEYIRERLTTEASYVVLKAEDFRAAQKVTEDEIKQRYEAKKDFLKSPEMRKVHFAAFTLPPAPDGKPVEESKKTDELQKLANAAYDFATELQKPGVDFDEAAKRAGATVGNTAEFFPRDASPPELEGSPVAAEAAFALTKAKPYSAHIPLAKGTYVLELKEVKPPEQLPLDKVRTQIEAELIGEKADTAMMEKARALREKLAEACKARKSFTDAAQSLGVKVVAFPAYSLMQRIPPSTPYAQVVEAAAGKLAPGDVSHVVPTAGAALIVHLDQRPAVDEKDMQEATARIAEGIQSGRQMVAFQAWLMDQRTAAGIKPLKEH
ncbi:MAG: peptidyl-prolyl cis-trans isomerase, partial [Chthoniobacteraceae bacterium]